MRAGEYIQIIDVAGRQCTDFQCFAPRKLDKGVDYPLDVTTTRSLIGQSYPPPGLRSKAWIGGDDYRGIWLRELAEKLRLKAGCALPPINCTTSRCKARRAATSWNK